MAAPLLPASAAAFAPRASSVNVVLGSKAETWLKQTLKRIDRVRRPLNSVLQHRQCLTEMLSLPNAIWTLASIMLPKSPEADFKRDQYDPFAEDIMDYKLVHIEAYVVHIDMVSRNEVAYKLTKDTIDTLVEHHKEVYRVDAKANTCDWPDGEQQCKKLHEDFIQAINTFVFRTHVSALEGLEEGGTGELLNGRSNEVKDSIVSLMKPPRPRVVDVIQQPSLLHGSPMDNVWPQPGMPSSQPAIELWRVPPSSSSVASPAGTDNCLVWVPMAQSNPVPAPAFTQPHSTAGLSYSSPQATAPIPALPLPSMLAPAQYGISMGMAVMEGGGGFCWDQYQECAAITHVFTIPQNDSPSSVVVSSSECAFLSSFKAQSSQLVEASWHRTYWG